jgi:cleavage and polyadenylation specificity factor subunit 1
VLTISRQVFELPNLEQPVYSTEALPFLPGTISDSFVPRRYATKETLAEILVADIGDSIVKSPYLIVSCH